MIIQATSHGTAAKEEPFAFTYSGNYTDNRVDGVGTVRLNTSGTLTVTGSPVTVSATIVGAGGGAVGTSTISSAASGGGGGIQTVAVTLAPGIYDIIIGTGGAGVKSGMGTGGNGGSTTAFEKTSTGGGGAYKANALAAGTPGVGGTPNGSSGSSGTRPVGGSPNGGAVTTAGGQAGGDGYVEITFS